jgi:cardiolipin synthase
MNLDFLSMEWLEEGSLVVDDEAFAHALEARWHADMARSHQMTGEPPPPPPALPERRPDVAPYGAQQAL